MSDSTQQSIDAPAKPQILGIEPRFNAAYVVLKCNGCGQQYMSPQTIVAGLPVGEHVCKNCNTKVIVYPDDFYGVLDKFWPEQSLEEITLLMVEASRVTSSWSEQSDIKNILTYEGIPLGRLTRYTSFNYIVRGLHKLHREG